MFFVSLGRTITFAFQSFWRNIWLSVITIFILVLTLFSISLALSVNLVAGRAIDAIREKVDVSVFFKADAPEEEILNLKEQLEQHQDVRSVTFVTKEEALAAFQARHAGQKDIEEALTAVEGNPLSPHLVIRARELEDFPGILAFLEGEGRDRYIEDTDRDFEDSQKVISRLSGISQRVKQVGVVVSAIFVIVSLLVVFNTMRMTIYAHREEIGIMKLVGATNWFVRAPFLLESFLYALLAAAVSLALLAPLLNLAAPVLSRYFADYGLNLAPYASERFWSIILWQFGLAVLLSMLSSVVAIRRYLRV